MPNENDFMEGMESGAGEKVQFKDARDSNTSMIEISN